VLTCVCLPHWVFWSVSPVFVTARLVRCRVGFLCSPVDFRRAFSIPLSNLGLQRAAGISSPDLFVGIARALNGRRFSFPSQSALGSSSLDFGFGCGPVSPFPAQLTRGGFSFSCSAPVDLGAVQDSCASLPFTAAGRAPRCPRVIRFGCLIAFAATRFYVGIVVFKQFDFWV
jgi:hypothetical protein